MPVAATPHADERDRSSLPAPPVEVDSWLDEALADSFPASDPLSSHRFD
ncbi:hypothetical protein [Methylobacterium gnaphalii]|uniref:Uncharacterized protein n=1 Tax=Methylobacterium gnaphalii TaxID=1010610 RepID=A0A512JQZ9_9HYPH|nr:hypothetical protein [Methylobacterium gnaphalii]GEP12388.1 hypothetical protein MGN01_42330 [Methylobacterium gnaphalii]GJD71168.1 hypothetical protein MMMDOFMJ_4122 [Methylobacterium gnaphalii]GLS51552.1 hypothetical protein GCM10007885_44100 [Methylobacterium gnaphalii]